MKIELNWGLEKSSINRVLEVKENIKDGMECLEFIPLTFKYCMKLKYVCHFNLKKETQSEVL